MEKISLFFRMLNQIFEGKYKPRKRNFILILFLFIYFISPIDFIPELFLGFFGLVDDAAILAFIYSRINKELEKFVLREKQKLNQQANKIE